MKEKTYSSSGVDVRAADRLIKQLSPLIRSTHGPEVIPDKGQFAGLFRLFCNKFKKPVLVSSTDGVGTKIKIAQLADSHFSVGIDAVAMNTNDILAYGAKPMFFLDYIAIGKINPKIMTEILRGIVEGCRQSDCALLGGETAEMPGVYGKNEYDVAGFCVGITDSSRLIDGSNVKCGDHVIGLASSGLHSNGFSLVRKALGKKGLKRFQKKLLVPTRIYVKPVLKAIEQFKITAIAHVTGGGLSRRLPSLVSNNKSLFVDYAAGSWRAPDIFKIVQEAGKISINEMYGTFNMGIGMAIACRKEDSAGVLRLMKKEGIDAWQIGIIQKR